MVSEEAYWLELITIFEMVNAEPLLMLVKWHLYVSNTFQ